MLENVTNKEEEAGILGAAQTAFGRESDSITATAVLPAEIQKKLRAELESKHGIAVEHYRRPPERPFTASERDSVTILFGGLTKKHEHGIEGTLRSMGYRIKALPDVKVDSYHTGKEYGNNGQCNPAYFTVGNLVDFLKGLERAGLSKQEIQDKYILVTAASCGPCRFGMYEFEYRHALANAGFAGFRVVLFAQNPSEAAERGYESGIDINTDFIFAMMHGCLLGDILYQYEYRMRPYAIDPVRFKALIDSASVTLRERLHRIRPYEISPNTTKLLGSWSQSANKIAKVYNYCTSNAIPSVLSEIFERFNEVEVDRLRVKPVVKVTGEFWAQTTESDGNFNMFSYLEEEGAEVLVEPVATWLHYLFDQSLLRAKERRDQAIGGFDKSRQGLFERIGGYLAETKKYLITKGFLKLYLRQYHRFCNSFNGHIDPLIDQELFRRLAGDYYNPMVEGGEGHLEVAKSIYYTKNRKAHMVLSLKPFGCMPSTQSDGVHSAVTAHHPDMLFLSIETSSDGKINAYSRVQMALAEAKIRARKEFETALETTGLTQERLREYANRHSHMNKATYKVPSRKGITCSAANFVYHVADLMGGGTSRRA